MSIAVGTRVKVISALSTYFDDVGTVSGQKCDGYQVTLDRNLNTSPLMAAVLEKLSGLPEGNTVWFWERELKVIG